MYCPQCGKEIKPGQPFCSFCGTRLNTAPRNPPQQDTQPQPIQPAQQAQPIQQIPIQQIPIVMQPIIGYAATPPAQADVRGQTWGQPAVPVQSAFRPQQSYGAEQQRMEAQQTQLAVVKQPEIEEEVPKRSMVRTIVTLVIVSVLILGGFHYRTRISTIWDHVTNGTFVVSDLWASQGKDAGKTNAIGDINITMQEYESNWTGYSPFLAPDEGSRIIKVSFSFTNSGKTALRVGSGGFTCYADDVQCPAYGVNDGTALPTQTELAKGAPVTGSVYYEVPANAKNIVLEYDTVLGSAKFEC